MKFKLKRSFNFWLDFTIFKFLEYKRLKKKNKDESLSVVYNNDYISNEVIAFGSFEKDLQNVIFKFLYKFKKKFSKGTCLDVGANIGTFSINNSKYFKKIYGFEPETKSFEIYKLNSSSKNNIFPLNFGLGNKNCYKELYIDKINRGESSLRPRSKINKLKSKIKIQKLDTTNINLTNLSFIKVDIEDSEDDFFKGARKTIETFKPIIAFEYRNKIRQNLNFPIIPSDYHFFKYEDNSDQNYSFFRKRILNFYEFFLGKKVNISKLDNLENKDYSLIIAVPSKDLNKLPINFNRKRLNIKIKKLNFDLLKKIDNYVGKISSKKSIGSYNKFLKIKKQKLK